MLPSFFSVEEEAEVKTVAELNEEFYPLVTFKKKEMKRAYRNKRLARVIRPQVLVLNPPGYGDSDSVVQNDVYVAVYYRGYHVRIEHGKSMFGPHKFELMFQVCTGRRVWLGTHTAKFNFFSTKELKKQLKLAILEQSYYCSPKSGEELVEFEIKSAPIAVEVINRQAKPKRLYRIGKFIVRHFYDV